MTEAERGKNEIVVAHDGSLAALAAATIAIQIAHSLDLSVHGLYVVDETLALETYADYGRELEVDSEPVSRSELLARFEEPLRRNGPWFYRRLFWECGMVGQVLYLEAEVHGVRGTGIGCFFDDDVHRLLGLEGSEYQSLYHFTVGKPVVDARVRTLAAYPNG